MNRYDYDTWFVYELIDPRDKKVFYIGKTATPKARLAAHKTKPESAAFSRIGEIRAAGFEVEQYIIARFNTEHEAFDYEGYLIRKTPALVNRQGYLASQCAENFVRPLMGIPDLGYTTVENQPVPDEETISQALAIQLPQIGIEIIRQVVRAQATLLDVEYEYCGISEE